MEEINKKTARGTIVADQQDNEVFQEFSKSRSVSSGEQIEQQEDQEKSFQQVNRQISIFSSNDHKAESFRGYMDEPLQ